MFNTRVKPVIRTWDNHDSYQGITMNTSNTVPSWFYYCMYSVTIKESSMANIISTDTLKTSTTQDVMWHWYFILLDMLGKRYKYNLGNIMLIMAKYLQDWACWVIILIIKFYVDPIAAIRIFSSWNKLFTVSQCISRCVKQLGNTAALSDVY